MRRFTHSILISLLLSATAAAEDAGSPWLVELTHWIFPNLAELASEIAMLDRQISRLPAPSATNSTGSTGFITVGTDDPVHHWVRVELPRAEAVDQVVLVPTLLKGAEGDVAGYGFPVRFMLEGLDDQGRSITLIDKTGEDFPNPRLFPVSVACPPGTKLQGIKLTATLPWSGGGSHLLSLAEIMLLKGNLNLASGAPVSSSSSREFRPIWSRQGLTDMVTPLGLPLNPGTPGESGWQSLSATTSRTEKSFMVDLGRSWPIDVVRLVPCFRPDFQSQNQYGFPACFSIEISEDPDFEKKSVIVDRLQTPTPIPGQNLREFSAGGKVARYIRMNATRLRNRNEDFIFAMAELQAYSGGVNRALGAELIADELLVEPGWSRNALTDGKTAQGRLLELPEWIETLNRARHLIDRRDEAVRGYNRLRAKAERTIVASSVGGGTVVAIFATAVAIRAQRRRRADREALRERLARDLHDELGSNLASISLTASFADAATPEQMRADLGKIEKVARESTDSMRDMVCLLAARRDGGHPDWLKVIAEAARRATAGTECDLLIPAGPLSFDPTLETRREIYLFCKEALHNAKRHSGATLISCFISPTTEGIRVEISDNGCGFDPACTEGGQGLGNLRERAVIMKGRMDIRSCPGEGTTVTLNVPRNRHWTRRPVDPSP